MGTDISGWIEARDKRYDRYEAMSPVGSFLHRNYGMFGYLFGVRRTLGNPIFGGRGIPDNESWRTRENLHDKNILIQKQNITMKKDFPDGVTYQEKDMAGTTKRQTKPLEKGETYKFRTDITDQIPVKDYESHDYEYEYNETAGGHNLTYFTLEEFKNRIDLEDEKEAANEPHNFVIRFYFEKDGEKKYLMFYSRKDDSNSLNGRESDVMDNLKEKYNLDESEIKYEIDRHRIKDYIGLSFVQMIEYMEYIETIPHYENTRCVVWFGS